MERRIYRWHATSSSRLPPHHRSKDTKMSTRKRAAHMLLQELTTCLHHSPLRPLLPQHPLANPLSWRVSQPYPSVSGQERRTLIAGRGRATGRPSRTPRMTRVRGDRPVGVTKGRVKKERGIKHLPPGLPRPKQTPEVSR